MKKMKALAAMLLAVALTVSCLSACGSDTAGNNSNADGGTTATGQTRPTTTGQADNSLTVAMDDQVSTLDPELFTRQSEDSVIAQIYEPLFYMDNDGTEVNLLIEAYTENEDGSVDFVLKSDVKFHSGDTLKAEDVEYTLARSENSPICSQLYGNIVMTITDDTHFTWEFPNAGFQDLKTYIQLMRIVNKSFCEELISDPNESLEMNEDGTGPYAFVEKTSNGDVTLERFADYHGEASIDTIRFMYLTGSQETAFEAGDLDYAEYGATNFDLIQEYANVTPLTQVLNKVSFLICNCTDGSPTSDLRVRQAIAYCLNKDDITAIGTNGAGTPAYNIATPLVQHYADVCDHFAQNVDTANALMAEAGYSESSPLELTLIVSAAEPSWVSACEVMKEELEQSYFTVNIEQVADTSRFFTYDFDLGMLSITLTTQFSSFAAMYQEGSGIDLSGINDPEITAAFSAMTDEATTQNAMKVATESLAYIPLFYNTAFYAFDSNLNAGAYSAELTNFLYREFSWK